MFSARGEPVSPDGRTAPVSYTHLDVYKRQDPEYLLADNQSPRMKNVWFDGRTLSKRPGQRAVAAPPGEAELGAMIEFGGALYAVAGSKLYRFEEEFCELYDGIADSEGTRFRFGSAIYYLSKKEYLRCDGETVEAVEPYVPTIVINRPPDGEGRCV